MTRKLWTDVDRLQALSLYCRLSFGQLHQRNPDVVALAGWMGRTPSSVAMKLTNYSSLDPEVLALGKRGLPGASQKDKRLWERFIAEPEAVAQECENAWQEIEATTFATSASPLEGDEVENDFTGRETQSWIRHRLGQSLFRKAVMIRYGAKCIITGLRHEDLLIASHIIPWKARPESRLDPANGLCLNALHDRAFDKGLLGIDDRDRIRISTQLNDIDMSGHFKGVLATLEGQPLILSRLVFPNRDYLAWHFRECFRS